jgi:pimeloyl-ACP methyl ester carboxylesterase
MNQFVDTSSLRIAYVTAGEPSGWPVVLLHGFPYDVHAYDSVALILADAGARVFVPYLRGFGATRFLRRETLRSGEQAALGCDLRDFIERLSIVRPIVAGYDWGGRAACVVSALWPQLVAGLVSCNSYNIQDIASANKPAAPEHERRLWYQYYFHSERGRRGLTENRKALCRLLWELWSPTWAFKDEDYERTAESFSNPDFVEVVLHSYRHRYGLVPGDPAFDEMEWLLAARPKITVPCVTLDGAVDGVSGGSTASHAQQFSGRHEHVMVDNAGHNLPQEAPREFANAILRVRGWT